MLEGRAAIIIDGVPFVLTVPMLFVEHLQDIEDYAVRSYYATFIRSVRLLAFLISISAPALFIAIACFHQELIPTPLLFTMIASSEGLPFPSILEVVLMLFIFELIREAGLRLPKPIGQAISIVGALVMGQSAVEAGIVGAPVVIVIALTAVASFVSPFVNDAATLLRWHLLLLASIMGGVGFCVGAYVALMHLVSLESFGVPFMYPFAPFELGGLKDTVYRTHLWNMRTRPEGLRSDDPVRQNMQTPDFTNEKKKEDSLRGL
jgi:spore germination protein KA